MLKRLKPDRRHGQFESRSFMELLGPGWGVRVLLVVGLFEMAAVAVGAETLRADWAVSRPYRIEVTVETDESGLKHRPIGARIDFQRLLRQSGLEARVNIHSIRVMAVAADGGQTTVNSDSGSEIPFATSGDFFNDDAGYVWWRRDDPRTTRFHIYFDVLRRGERFHDSYQSAPQTIGLVGVGDTFHYNNGQTGEVNAFPLHSQFWHVDWDGDGKRDYIGFGYRVYEHGAQLERELGNTVYFFKNIGSVQKPLFTPRQRVKGADGQYLHTTLLSQNMFPADWDGDGDLDFYGNGRNYELLLWINAGGRDSNGLAQLQAPMVITKLDQESAFRESTPGILRKSRAFSPRSVRRVDWDDDGDFDLIVSYRKTNRVREVPRGAAVMPYGAGIQIFDLFENVQDGQSNFNFAKPRTLFEERGLPIYAHSVATGGVEYFDWDGDGDRDLLFHDATIRPLEGGRLMFAENRGSPQEPLFSMPLPIFKISESPWIVDWNEDGRFDLIAGGEFIENTNPDSLPSKVDGGSRQQKSSNQSPRPARRSIVSRTPTGTRIPHAWSFPKLKSHGIAQQIHPEILNYFTISVDWEADGDLDLLGGYHIGLRLFRNRGTTRRPVFDAPTAVVADGKPLQMPNWLDPQSKLPTTFGPQGPSEPNYGWMCPTVGDWDADGDLDLFVTGQRWQTLYFENIGTRKEPRLAQGREVRCDGRIHEFSWRSKVSIGDIDADGDMEMVVTADHDNVFYSYEQQPQQPDAGGLELTRGDALLLESGEPVKGWYGGQNNNGDNHSLLVDWDADGDLDLINGTLWAVWYYENVGAAGRPRFRSRDRFQAGGQVIHTFNHAGSFDAADWNGDGRLDLVLGTECPSDQPRGGVLHLFDRSFLDNKLLTGTLGQLQRQ